MGASTYIQHLDVENVHKAQARNFQLPSRLLAGAGPTNCSPRVLRALAESSLGIVDPEVLKMLDEIKELLKYIFQTKNKLTLLQQTSGTGGMETAICNLLEEGQKIIIAIGGVWGERAAQIAERYKLEVIRLSVNLGEVYSLSELEKAIETHKPQMLFITHGESSHGTLQPLEGLADICHKHNCLLAVDCIVSIGAAPFFADRWGIDVAIGATQKAVSAPPGMSLLTFSPRAEEVINNRKSLIPFYYDVKALSVYWGINSANQYYYYSYNSHMLAATKEALCAIADEGLLNVWQRHRDINKYFLEKTANIGLYPVVKVPEKRLPSVVPLTLPEGVNWQKLVPHLYQKYNMEVGFGIGPTQGSSIRVGVMGYNARKEVVDYIVDSLESAMKEVKEA